MCDCLNVAISDFRHRERSSTEFSWERAKKEFLLAQEIADWWAFVEGVYPNSRMSGHVGLVAHVGGASGRALLGSLPHLPAEPVRRLLPGLPGLTFHDSGVCRAVYGGWFHVTLSLPASQQR